MAPPSSPISALSLRIFGGRGSSTAAHGTLDRFGIHCPAVRLQSLLDIKQALMAAKDVALADEGEHLPAQVHQPEG